MSRNELIRFTLFLFLILVVACTQEKKKVEQEDVKVPVPAFNQDSCYTFIEKQLAFGPRVPNMTSHQECRDWLISKMEAYGAEVTAQHFTPRAFDGTTLNSTNVVARFNPEVRQRVLLCAHWDTRPMADKDTVDRDQPIPGADDGASGVAVLLEIARQLQMNPIPMGVDIVLFDAEDYGADEPGHTYTWGLGSQYWSKNLPDKNYEVKYGVLLDMVGSKDARFTREGFSRQTAPVVTDKIWILANKMGKGKYFPLVDSDGIIDDHFFIIENAKIPMINILNLKANQDFGDYHHTHSDNIEIIDKNTLQAVGQVVLAVVYQESNKAF